MPIAIQQISPRRYMVLNTQTKEVHAFSTTLKNAKAQKRLLDAIDHGYLLPTTKTKNKNLGTKKRGNGNPWIAHVKQVAQQKGIPYRQALQVASKTYRASPK